MEKNKNRPIGFSLGSLYRIKDKFSKEAFDILNVNNREAIEIMAVDESEVDRMKNTIVFAQEYAYKSIHLPVIRYRNDLATKAILDKIEDYYEKIGADLALVHPDSVDDWSVFEDYPLNWAIENMDNRKENFRGAEDLKEFFVRHENWKMVLDLNHCYSNDKSMKLAQELIDEFQNRIVQIHLSGFVDFHEPLHQTKQEIILDFCKQLDALIIIESVVDSIGGVKKEYGYIKRYLI